VFADLEAALTGGAFSSAVVSHNLCHNLCRSQISTSPVGSAIRCL
jgi:hypothetical protein